MANSPVITLAFVGAAALSLMGCGSEQPVAAKTPAPGVPTEKRIFVSSADCEMAGQITFDDCAAAIDKAVQLHDKKAPSYKSLGTCEETEGVDKCERIGDRAFRPRLAAFLLESASPPTAKPLYLTKDGALGFRGSDQKEQYLSKDDNLLFTKSAVDLYELHKKTR